MKNLRRHFLGSIMLGALVLASVWALGVSFVPTEAQASVSPGAVEIQSCWCAGTFCCHGSCWLPWRWSFRGTFCSTSGIPGFRLDHCGC